MSEPDDWGLDTSGKSAQSKAREGADSDESQFVEHLRAVIQTFDVVNILTEPMERSLKHLLSVAADSFGCDEASIIVREGDGGYLKFMCAIGEVAEVLLKVKIPPGKGIAGFVFETGQPMVVGDAGVESAFYSDIDRVTGYSTQTLLATPLNAGGRVIGVLEFVNRVGDPPYHPFTPDEMNRAAYFATAIAPLVEAYEIAGLVEALFGRALEQARTTTTGVEDGQRTNEGLRQLLKNTRSTSEHRDLMMLAVTLRDIAGRGDAEREMCRDVLSALARFTEKDSGLGAGYLVFPEPNKGIVS